jgi:hypothetical protein
MLDRERPAELVVDAFSHFIDFPATIHAYRQRDDNELPNTRSRFQLFSLAGYRRRL